MGVLGVYMENEISFEQAVAKINEKKKEKEEMCLRLLNNMLKEYNCRLVVPILRLVDGKLIPEIAIEAL